MESEKASELGPFGDARRTGCMLCNVDVHFLSNILTTYIHVNGTCIDGSKLTLVLCEKIVPELLEAILRLAFVIDVDCSVC